MNLHDRHLASLDVLGKLITDAVRVMQECQNLPNETIYAEHLELQKHQTSYCNDAEVKHIQTPPDLISLAEAAKRLGITSNTMLAMRRAGRLPEPIHVSRRKRAYLREDIEDWIRSGGMSTRTA